MEASVEGVVHQDRSYYCENPPACFLQYTSYLVRGATICTPTCFIDRRNKKTARSKGQAWRLNQVGVQFRKCIVFVSGNLYGDMLRETKRPAGGWGEGGMLLRHLFLGALGTVNSSRGCSWPHHGHKKRVTPILGVRPTSMATMFVLVLGAVSLALLG